MPEKCKASVFRDFSHIACGKRVVKGSEYCVSHDPVRQQQRSAAWEAKYRAKQDRTQAIHARANELGARLGVPAQAEYNGREYVERLVLSFADAEALIARLSEK